MSEGLQPKASTATPLRHSLLHELLSPHLSREEIYRVLSINPDHGTAVDEFFPNARVSLPHPEELEFFTHFTYPQHPMNFPAHSIDVVFGVECFRNFCRPSEALWEALRVLKFGGVYVVTYDKTEKARLGQKFFLPFRECEVLGDIPLDDQYNLMAVRWHKPKIKAFEPGTFLWPTILPKDQKVALGQRADALRTPYFFFYGTLMERYGNYKRHLQKHAITIETAFCAGNLFALPMGFPGLVRDSSYTSGYVAGEVMTFADPYAVLRTLDKLEEFFPDRPDSSMYLRQLLPVKVLVKEPKPVFSRRLAWVYVFPDRNLFYVCQSQGLPIGCGSWKAYRSANADHSWSREELDFAHSHLLTPSHWVGIEGVEADEVSGNLPCFKYCHNKHLCPWVNLQNL
ncbi:gamma-glutamylcyclotransferase family protein [Desulfurispira natronophila]|uniref:Gamma-glutamylcyclotransferase (GGCT)/AIG2-like uncharacterized protein YtfP n=1 Tax=Desulfurispira natronophila TaxID=682562 RepID=A0A7W8DHU6_9BACT|nr:gamma-glutamylcyclotransferase family protein [Desulfurispira natronophila]MBB5022668.1 gamma-glutamylcyclotransferase (GGCT)/AIG2-like uncharacterized protein YtfP [Desulfurispira natronophila]